MVAYVLAIAPPEHFDVILAGLSALKDELNWFSETVQQQTEAVSLNIAKLEKDFLQMAFNAA